MRLALLVPVIVVLAVVVFELLRAVSSKGRRAALRDRIASAGVTTTVIDLLKSHRQEKNPMGTTAAGSVLRVTIKVTEGSGVSIIQSSSASTTATTGRQPANATKYVGALPAFARPSAGGDAVVTVDKQSA
jgi:hypothetical protein